MNEKDLKSRLNAELSNVTWTVRDSNAVRRRVNQGGMKKMKHSFVAIFAMILLLVFMATAAAAAISEDFNAWLYQIWPDAALKLMPVNMSCEDSGIRMEVISAVVNRDEMYVTFSLQDLEGDRIDKDTNVVMDANVEFFAGEGGGVVFDTPDPLYAEDGNKYIFAEHITLQGDLRMGVSQKNMRLMIERLENSRMSHIDLIPLYNEYAGQAQAMPVPASAYIYGAHVDAATAARITDGFTTEETIFYSMDPEDRGPVPQGMRVLDSAAGPELQLADHVYLSGIGMVDGTLRVQIHSVDMDRVDGSSQQYPADAYVYMEGLDGSFSRYSEKDALPDGITALVWGTRKPDGFGWEERWEEYIFTVPENEQVGDQYLAADITNLEDPIEGSWEVGIPVRLIREAK